MIIFKKIKCRFLKELENYSYQPFCYNLAYEIGKLLVKMYI